jgi:midasin
MKVLTGLELVLQKLEEWEVYASKRVGNSCEEEMRGLKQLIIRYRKLQILSWRNLLQWRKTKLVREDFADNFIRLAHTLERQVFDRQYYAAASPGVEIKMMEVLDLFMRDSSLGLFQARLAFTALLKDHFSHKRAVQDRKVGRLPEHMYARLSTLVNILDFVVGYYGQFEDKLVATVRRLDEDAREKVKTLIDVSKWNVQKFAQVKNNIDKRHRQLNKACK